MRVRERFKHLTVGRQVLSIIVIVGLAIALGWVLYLHFVQGLGWADWTGFGEYTNPKGEYQRAKTLWDWTELLIVPVVLAAVAWWLTKSDNQVERELATDRQQQSILESYLDQMSSLLLDEDLRESKQDAEVRSIARARTLAVLRTLDPARRSLVLMFLKESNLINKENVIVDLQQADLSGLTLEPGFQGAWDDTGWGFDLSNAYLEKVKLNRAKLWGVNLHGAKLSEADLTDADLYRADLSEADLYQTILRRTNLGATDLRGAGMKNAILIGADLRRAKWDEQLESATFFTNTVMPDGTIHQESWFERHRQPDKNATNS